MKKKVMVYAYTKFNLGDDLFIKMLCERYPSTKFFLYAPKGYTRIFNNLKDINNMTVIPSDNFIIRGLNYAFRLLKIDKTFFRTRIGNKCDAAVYIGGSLFMQNDRWKERYQSKKEFQINNKPFFLLGANFGPYWDEEFYTKHKELFRGYTDICFRDRYSYNLFKELPNVRIAEDIIFQLKDKPQTKKLGNKIAISVIKPSYREDLTNIDDIYYRKIKDIIIYFNNKGYQVTLMSFCEHEGDKEAIHEICKLLPFKHRKLVESYSYKYDINESLSIIKNSSYVVATRFHSMILGWVFGIPVYPIVYSDKMTNVMNDVGFSGLYTHLNKIKVLDPKEVYTGMQKNLIDVTDQIKNSEIQFEKLDEFLNKERV